MERLARWLRRNIILKSENRLGVVACVAIDSNHPQQTHVLVETAESGLGAGFQDKFRTATLPTDKVIEEEMGSAGFGIPWLAHHKAYRIISGATRTGC